MLKTLSYANCFFQVVTWTEAPFSPHTDCVSGYQTRPSERQSQIYPQERPIDHDTHWVLFTDRGKHLHIEAEKR